MKRVYLSSILLAITLIGCGSVSHRYPIKKPRRLNSSATTTTLSNKGTLCAYKPNSSVMVIKYYPLSTSCASSSAYSWKLNGLEVNVNGNKAMANSYSLFKKNNSPIATADCSGAGVKVKRVATSTPNTILYWGDTKLTKIKPNQDMKCFKSVGSGYVRVKPIQ